jgi:hypothetical protein
MSVKFPYLSARYVAIAIPSTESCSCTDSDDVKHPSSIWNSSAPTRTLRAWSVPPAALILVPCLGSIPASSASAGSGNAGQGLRYLCDRHRGTARGRSRKSEAKDIQFSVKSSNWDHKVYTNDCGCVHPQLRRIQRFPIPQLLKTPSKHLRANTQAV